MIDGKEKKGCTVEPAYSDTLGTRANCHYKRGVTISEVHKMVQNGTKTLI